MFTLPGGLEFWPDIKSVPVKGAVALRKKNRKGLDCMGVAECGGCGVWGLRSVGVAQCGGCRVLGLQSVGVAECGVSGVLGCGIWEL